MSVAAAPERAAWGASVAAGLERVARVASICAGLTALEQGTSRRR